MLKFKHDQFIAKVYKKDTIIKDLKTNNEINIKNTDLEALMALLYNINTELIK